jgi:hypothetical protein
MLKIKSFLESENEVFSATKSGYIRLFVEKIVSLQTLKTENFNIKL